MSLSVSLNKTLQNPYYLFSFTHIQSKDTNNFVPKVISTGLRYDEFQFTEGYPTNLTLDPPQVSFTYEGQYWVKVYEQTTSGNTNPSNTTSMLWEGRAVVEDNSVQEPYYQWTSDNEDNANYIFISDGEKPATPTPTPSISSTPSVTPSVTPTITPTASPSTTPPPSPTPSPYKMDIGTGFNEDLNGITADGNQFYAFGYFTSYNGYEAENVVRINQDGSVDPTFNVDFYKETPNAQIYGVNAQDPNVVFAFGNFLSYGNPVPNFQWRRVVKLNKTDGSLNTNFYSVGPNNDVYSVHVSGTSVWFMGNFTTWNGVTNTRFVQTDLDGNITNSYGTGTNALIRGYQIHPDGDMVIYGDFTTWTGTSVPGIAKINLTTGALDTSFMTNIGTGGAFNSKPRTIQIGPSGKIYVSYPQNTWNGFAASRLVILNSDGSVDTSFALPNSGGEPYSLLVDEPNDYIYYTGTINEVGGNTRYWGRWIISTASIDRTFTGVNSLYQTINQQPYLFPNQIYKDAQGRIYLVGRFTLYYNNDTNDYDDFNRIIRVYDDGTINTQST